MDVEKLIDRRLVNSEPFLATYLHSKAAKAGVPVSATFELTARCNFNCKMCYVHNQDSVSCRKHEKSAEWWIDLGKKAAEQGVIFLLLTGGEPFLREDFVEIYTGLSKLGFLISINTNGYLINDKIIELFKKRPPTRLNITLYGASEQTYEKLTGVSGCERVLSNIKRLRENNIDVRINGSFSKLNQCDIAEIYNISKELNLHVKATPYMFPQTLVGSKFGENPSRFSPEEAAQAWIDWIRLTNTEEDYKSRIKRMLDGIESLDFSCNEECEEGKVKCRAGRSNLWVNYRGEMTFCGVTGAKFDIDKNGFDGAWQYVREFADNVRTPAECEGCKYKNICTVCAAACYTETGSFSKVPEYVCRMTKHIAKLLEKEAERLGLENGN